MGIMTEQKVTPQLGLVHLSQLVLCLWSLKYARAMQGKRRMFDIAHLLAAKIMNVQSLEKDCLLH
jgi:hypothetical protein